MRSLVEGYIGISESTQEGPESRSLLVDAPVYTLELLPPSVKPAPVSQWGLLLISKYLASSFAWAPTPTENRSHLSVVVK